MVADKGKKVKIEEDNVDQLDGDLVFSIEKLQEIQDELEKINEEASDKVLEVEQQYNEVRRPFYDKRKKIITAIPNFWLTAFLSHSALSDLLNQEDHKIFKYLTSLEVEDSKDVKAGYSISFNFSANPYFEDSKVTKAFTFLDEGMTKITSTPIRWKEGMGIPNGKTFEKKKGNKRALDEEESFFTWFSENVQRDSDELHDVIAEIIRDDLWPNPLNYFYIEDEADEDEDFDDEGDDEEGKDEEGSDEDDDENGN